MSNTLLITSGKNWVEHTAIMQLNGLANLKGVVKAVGLPDLHAGETPIGVAAGLNYPLANQINTWMRTG